MVNGLQTANHELVAKLQMIPDKMTRVKESKQLAQDELNHLITIAKAHDAEKPVLQQEVRDLTNIIRSCTN